MSFYTIKRIAEELEVSTRTVHRWIAAGKLKTVRFNWLVRIPPGEVDRLKREGIK